MKTTINKESAVDYLMSNLEVCETKEDFMFIFWEYWAESVTNSTREFQQVLANASINKWFLIELEKEHQEYTLLSNRYNDIQDRDKIEFYCKCISKLLSRFPMALLEVAKKRTEKPQTTKVAGIKIETSILNQN